MGTFDKSKNLPTFRSLHMKMVLILVLLIVSVMAVVGTFLINGITGFYINQFRDQVSSVFSTEVISTLKANASYENAPQKLSDIVFAYSSSIGIDSYRNYYILDKSTGDFITGSNEALGRELIKTPNIISAMAGKVGDVGSIAQPYMDIAVPIQLDNHSGYIIYIKDTKQELSNLTWILFEITVQAIFFGLIAAVLLSFLLSKTMTNPIESLTKSIKKVSAGDFEHKVLVHSTDEIGILTETFNEMAEILKNTLRQAKQERDKLNTLFLHMTDGVAAFANDGHIIHMNFAAEKMLGIRFQEDLNFNRVFDRDYRFDAHKTVEQREITRDNHTYTVFFAPFGASEKESGIMTVIHDVTEQKKLDDARREFVANVSHELRTPLTNIKSYTETIIDNWDDLDKKTGGRFLSVISNETDRMIRIVKDLLTLSKLDYGRMDIEFGYFSLRKMLENIYQAMILQAKNSDHKLVFHVPDDLPQIEGDRARLEQVFVNILTNAIKYTQSGGEISLSAKVSYPNCVIIKVADNGIGIPKDDLPRLFERFYRVDKARSREGGGTGLGLAIAREIIRIHGGDITVESAPDVGTTMTVTLPICKPRKGDKNL